MSLFDNGTPAFVATTFVRAYPPAAPAPGNAAALVFRGDDLLVLEDAAGRAHLPRGDADRLASLAPSRTPPVYLGTLGGMPCLTWETDAAPPDDWRPRSLRALFGALDEPEYGLAGYASQLLHWQRTSRFCSACGVPALPSENDWGRRCTNCQRISYPAVHPAILVLVHDGGDRVLLVHKPGWGNRYSIIAGFVEPGESLEGCVLREVAEEVGAHVTDLAYQGSQPWPFPSQLMIGYTARYVNDVSPAGLALDNNELDDAKWFSADALPALPSPMSLSRQIIDRWAASRNGST